MTEGDRNNITSHPVQELFCSHKEADSHMLLHASHASLHGSTTVLLKSHDTDVAIIAKGMSHNLSSRLIFQTGTKQRQLYIDLTDVGAKLG